MESTWWWMLLVSLKKLINSGESSRFKRMYVCMIMYVCVMFKLYIIILYYIILYICVCVILYIYIIYILYTYYIHKLLYYIICIYISIKFLQNACDHMLTPQCNGPLFLTPRDVGRFGVQNLTTG